MIWSIAYTSVNVPYGSLQSVITTDSVQRAELSNASTASCNADFTNDYL